MEEIVGYKLNYQALDEENRLLREQVRKCEKQHNNTMDESQEGGIA